MFLKRCYLIAFIFLSSYKVVAATSEPEFDNGSFRINITGEITKNDLKTLQRVESALSIVAESNPNASVNFIVGLNSTGGDVESAIEIGRIMRKNNAIVIIAEPWKCYSSCVYLLAGATQRQVYGNVGIHRIYKIDDTVTAPSDQKKIQKKIEKVIKQYFEEMNIPTELYDESMRVPPEKNRILTSAELSKYGLNEDDPYYHDALISKFSKSLGITSSEYIERLARKNSMCKQYKNDQVKLSDCYIKIVDEGQLSYQ